MSELAVLDNWTKIISQIAPNIWNSSIMNLLLPNSVCIQKYSCMFESTTNRLIVIDWRVELLWLWYTQSAVGQRHVRNLDLSGMCREAPRLWCTLEVIPTVNIITVNSYGITFSALMLFTGWQEGRPASKELYSGVRIGLTSSNSGQIS